MSTQAQAVKGPPPPVEMEQPDVSADSQAEIWKQEVAGIPVKSVPQSPSPSEGLLCGPATRTWGFMAFLIFL